MPHGKPAGIPCVQLLPDFRCALFGKPERPAFCTSLRPAESMCGANRDDALARLTHLEWATQPRSEMVSDPQDRDGNDSVASHARKGLETARG